MAGKTVNGIELSRLHDTVRVLRDEPNLARFVFRARTEWVEGPHCQTTLDSFYGAGTEQTHAEPFVLHADEPPLLLGNDRWPGATEVLLHALGSCLTASFIFQAAARSIPIQELELQLSGQLDLRGFLGITDEVRNGYQRIEATFRIKADAPEEKLQELVAAAQQRSPVFDIVTHPVPVTVRYERK